MKRFLLLLGSCVLLLLSSAPLSVSAQGSCECYVYTDPFSGNASCAVHPFRDWCSGGRIATCLDKYPVCSGLCTCDDPNAPTQTPIPPPPTNTPAVPSPTEMPNNECIQHSGRCVDSNLVCNPPSTAGSVGCSPSQKCVPELARCVTPTPPGGNCSDLGGRCVYSTYRCTNIRWSRGQLDCGTNYICYNEDVRCTAPGTDCVNYKSGKCVSSNLICDKLSFGEYGCGPGQMCVPERANCRPRPTLVPTRPPARVFCKPGDPNYYSDPTGYVYTNLGCVPYSAQGFANKTLQWGVSIGGGLALLVLVYAALMYVSSGGDPKRVQAAKELIMALLGGLVLIIFSVLLLNYLGVNLLGLNKIGFGP